MRINKLLKPQIIITIQYIIITLLLIRYSKQNNLQNRSDILIYTYMPYLIYMAFVFMLSMINLKGKMQIKDNKLFKNQFTFKVIELIIAFSSIIHIISILEMIKFTGNNPLLLINKNNILFFQRNPGKYLSISIALMNIIPISLLIYYDYILNIVDKKRKVFKNILVCVYLLESLIICSAAGIRFLFIVNSIPLLINIIYNKKINFYILKRGILVGIIFGFIIFGGQAIKSQNFNLSDNISSITEYYTESIKNVFYIIDNNYGNINPNYWTIYRTFKGVPFINFNKIDEWYRSKYGFIPINNRDDDFEYVKKMGIQPKNNTFSIWGYAYLDYGQNGWILVTMQLILIQLIYFIASRSRKAEIFYCILILFIIEQIRTNGIINSRVINAFILFTILYFIDLIISKFFNNKYVAKKKFSS